MKNMKLDGKEKRDYMNGPAAQPAAPEYPFGLRIHLDNDSIKKLGIEKLPEVGSKMKLMAIVEVCDLSEHKSLYGDNKSLGLQITDMKLGSNKE